MRLFALLALLPVLALAQDKAHAPAHEKAHAPAQGKVHAPVKDSAGEKAVSEDAGGFGDAQEEMEMGGLVCRHVEVCRSDLYSKKLADVWFPFPAS